MLMARILVMTKLRLALSMIAIALATQGHAQSIDGAASKATANKQEALQPEAGNRETSVKSTANPRASKRPVVRTCSTNVPPLLPACAGSPAQGNSGDLRNRAGRSTTNPQQATEQPAGSGSGHDITRPEHRVDIFLNTNQASDGARSWTAACPRNGT
jgi:hypothetical protein